MMRIESLFDVFLFTIRIGSFSRSRSISIDQFVRLSEREACFCELVIWAPVSRVCDSQMYLLIISQIAFIKRRGWCAHVNFSFTSEVSNQVSQTVDSVTLNSTSTTISQSSFVARSPVSLARFISSRQTTTTNQARFVARSGETGRNPALQFLLVLTKFS